MTYAYMFSVNSLDFTILTVAGDIRSYPLTDSDIFS